MQNMKPTTWRVLALVAIACTLGMILFFPLLQQHRGTFGMTLRRDGPASGGYSVVVVDAGSTAARVAIVPGDRVIPDASVDARLNLLYPVPGMQVSVRVVRGSTERTATLIATQGAWESPGALLTILRLVMVAVAGLVAWRRPDEKAARNLTAFLTSFALGLGLGNVALPWPALTFTVYLLAILPLVYAMGAVARFSATFPQPDTEGPRSFLARVATVTSSGALVAYPLGAVAALYDVVDPRVVELVLGVTVSLCLTVAIINFVLAFRKASGSDRQRQLWVLLTFAVGLSGPFAAFVAIGLNRFSPTMDTIALVTIPALPIGLAFVILRHRLLDIGFVINRAVVFGGVSVIVVGVFVIVEFLLTKTFEHVSDATNLIVQMGVALSLGLSMRYVHKYVDRFVDDLFFRKRHEAEAALRRFAREAMMITDIGALFDQTIDTVTRYTNASSAQIYVHANDGWFALVRPDGHLGVSENDPALLSMRTWLERVDLTDTQSSITGEYAFPFVVRGKVAGLLACGSKASSEPYAPDELDAIMQLATGVGLAYDALEVEALKREAARILGQARAQPEGPAPRSIQLTPLKEH